MKSTQSISNVKFKILKIERELKKVRYKIILLKDKEKKLCNKLSKLLFKKIKENTQIQQKTSEVKE